MSNTNPNIQSKKSGRYIVASTFRSITDFSRVHTEGEDVSSFTPERLTDLVKRGLVEFIPNPEPEEQPEPELEKQPQTEVEEKSKRGRKPKNLDDK